MKSIRIIALLALLAACSHDAKRENPLDPELTPSVVLTVAADDTAGTATLTWTRYEGRAPFAEYRVLRNITQNTVADTITTIADVAGTTYTDSALAPDTAYEYRLVVVNAAGYESTSAVRQVEGYSTAPVRLLAAVGDSAAATVTLVWGRYRDAGFSAYRVQRLRVDTVEDEALVAITVVGDTSFVDTTALHEVDYVYRVVVQAAGKELESGGLAYRLSLLPVEITSLEFDSRSASATLTWTQHVGPPFLRYEVHRRVAGGTFERVRQQFRQDETTYTDPGLHGNQLYEYRIHTVTTFARDETILGSVAAGRFHGVQSTWILDLPVDAFVRLYNEGPDRISALVSTEDVVWLWRFDTDGTLLEEQLLYERPSILPNSPGKSLP